MATDGDDAAKDISFGSAIASGGAGGAGGTANGGNASRAQAASSGKQQQQHQEHTNIMYSAHHDGKCNDAASGPPVVTALDK